MDKAQPVLTAETFVIPLEEKKFLVYAPLRNTAFVANAPVVNFLADCKEGKWREESDSEGTIAEFLHRLDILDADDDEEAPQQEFRGKPRPTAVTLFLTTACNLRCTYCYASAGDTPARFMKPEVARRGVEYVARNAARLGASDFTINYHGGGEPTVNWPTLTGSHAFARDLAQSLELKVRAFTATNGVLRDAQIDWIIGNLDGASVSMDGLPHVQDKNRPKAGGEGSSENLLRTIQRFNEAQFPYGIRVTCTAENIEHLADSVDFICSSSSATRVQVEPAYQMGRWLNAPSAESEAFIAAYRESQVRAAKHGKEISYSAARAGTLTNHFCGVTQDSFALSPDGNVSACFEVFSETDPDADVFFYGKPDDKNGYNFDLKRLGHLRKQAVQHREFCRGCFAKWNCAGDCYHKSVVVNGTTEFAGSDRCHITREITKDQILALIEKSGGIVWKGANDRESCESKGKEMLA